MALFSELKEANPRLFYDAVCRGNIPYSEAGALQTGSNVTNTFVESLFGYPKPPEVSSYNPETTDIIGPGTGYPKPWRSLSQFNQNASYGSLIGPYARLVKLPNGEIPSLPNTCIGDKPPQCGESERGGIFGRIGIGDGNYLGFRAQNWYGQEEGTYGTAYYNGLGANWPTWKEWWSNSTKSTITVVWEDIPESPVVEVEVAHGYLGPDDAAYFDGPNLFNLANASYSLLLGMIALASFTRW